MLLNLCIEQDKEFEQLDKEKISQLSLYAVEVRYADEFYLPSVDEAKDAFELAQKVKAFVLKKLKIKAEDL